MIPLSHLSFAQGWQVKCLPKKKVILKVSHSVVAEGTVCVCVCGGGGGGGRGAKAVRHDRNFCNFFNLNNFTFYSNMTLNVFPIEHVESGAV